MPVINHKILMNENIFWKSNFYSITLNNKVLLSERKRNTGRANIHPQYDGALLKIHFAKRP